MEYKNYYNKENVKLIRKYLKNKSYDPRWKGLIEEVFLRRAYELDLSKKYLKEDLNNFVSNIDLIRFVPGHSFEKKSNMGMCNFARREISINEDFYRNMLTGIYDGKLGTKWPIEKVSEMIFSTLTHEIGHAAGGNRKKNRYGLSSYNYASKKWEGVALDEVFVETTANRCAFSRTSVDIERYRSETDGYSDITFVSNVLAATFGATEKEALREASRGRNDLLKLLLKNTCNQDRSMESFNAIETNLDILYNANYKETGKYNEEAIKSSLLAIYRNAMYELKEQIAETANLKDVNKFLADVIYRKSKIQTIMNDAISKNVRYGRISTESEKEIYEGIKDFRQELTVRTENIDIVHKNSNKFESKEIYNQAIEFALKGKINQYSEWYKQKYDINLADEIDFEKCNFENSVTQELEYESRVIREDFDDGRIWNNRNISNDIISKFQNELNISSRTDVRNNQDTEPIETVQDTEPIEIVEDTEKLETIKENLFQKAGRVIKQFFTRLSNKDVKMLNSGEYSMQDHYVNLANAGDIKRKEDYEEIQNGLDKYRIEHTPLYDERFSNLRNEEENKEFIDK